MEITSFLVNSGVSDSDRYMFAADTNVYVHTISPREMSFRLSF